jgi:predicted dehydrogenase
LDYALWLFGRPRTVYALGGHLSRLDLDVEDTATLLLDCGSDHPLPVSVHLNYLQKPPVKQCTIVGDRGTIRCDILACTAHLTDVDSGQTTSYAASEFQRNDMYIAFLRAFLAAIDGRGEVTVSLQEAIATMHTIGAAHTSMATGQVVSL